MSTTLEGRIPPFVQACSRKDPLLGSWMLKCLSFSHVQASIRATRYFTRVLCDTREPRHVFSLERSTLRELAMVCLLPTILISIIGETVSIHLTSDRLKISRKLNVNIPFEMWPGNELTSQASLVETLFPFP